MWEWECLREIGSTLRIQHIRCRTYQSLQKQNSAPNLQLNDYPNSPRNPQFHWWRGRKAFTPGTRSAGFELGGPCWEVSKRQSSPRNKRTTLASSAGGRKRTRPGWWWWWCYTSGNPGGKCRLDAHSDKFTASWVHGDTCPAYVGGWFKARKPKPQEQVQVRRGTIKKKKKKGWRRNVENPADLLCCNLQSKWAAEEEDEVAVEEEGAASPRCLSLLYSLPCSFCFTFPSLFALLVFVFCGLHSYISFHVHRIPLFVIPLFSCLYVCIFLM